jgi:predicted MFS family arabinose efflux permease
MVFSFVHRVCRRSVWPGVVAVGAGTLILVMSEFLPIGLLGAIVADLKVSDGEAGLMVTAPGVMAAVSAPLLTWVAGTVDRRLMLWSLAALLVVSNLVAALAPAFAVVLLARLLLGVAVGGFWTIGAGIAPRLVPPAQVPRAAAVISSGITIGTVVSLPLGPLIGNAAGWRAAFLVPAALALVVLVAQVLTLPSVPVSTRVTAKVLLSIFRQPKARLGVVIAALSFLGHFVGYTYLIPYFRDLAHLAEGTITVALLVFGAAGIVGNFVAGVTATRSVRGTLVVSTGLMGASIVLLPVLGTGVPGAIALTAVWGFAWGGVPVALQLWMINALGETAEGGLALFTSATQISVAAGSFVGGVLVDGAGIAVTLIVAAVVVLAATAAAAVRSRYHETTPAEHTPAAEHA